MEHKRKKLKIVSILIWSSSNILLIAQIVLIFILYNKEGLCWLRYMGWVGLGQYMGLRLAAHLYL